MIRFIGIFLLATLASAQYLVKSSSFGYGDRISPNNYAIPGWHVSGDGQVPQLQSDKIILTPPYPGNVRGAVWSESKMDQNAWTAELNFRASGPDRGSGNLQLWYTKDGRKSVETSSLYTVGNFDGMVLTVDQYGGKGGSIRGFMNDGNIDFKHHYAVDSLAFGHCDFAFRNLGRPSKLKVRQAPDIFEVIIDERLCFSTDKIRMPPDYTFGLTAASAETPDSFEVYKFQVFSSQSEGQRDQRSNEQPPAIQAPETRTPTYPSYDAQFEDLHIKMQDLSHAIQKVQDEIGILHRDSGNQLRDISRGLLNRDTVNTITSQNDKIDRIERTISSFQSQFSVLQGVMKDSHDSLTEGIPKHLTNIITTNAPRMGFLIAIFVAIQVMLYGVYTIYKRRSKQGPKKYL